MGTRTIIVRQSVHWAATETGGVGIEKLLEAENDKAEMAWPVFPHLLSHLLSAWGTGSGVPKFLTTLKS